MAHNSDDPRIRKTRKGLQDAFVRLIMRSGYDAISIQDIAAEAQTARVTFYRHYRDKEELLKDCLNTLYEDLSAKTERMSAAGMLSGYSPVSVLYEHIEEREELYRILFSSHGTHAVMERLREAIANHALKTMRGDERTRNLNIPPEIVANHVASAQLGLAIWWLDHNKPYPASYMAQISLWLSLMGFFEAVGVSGFKPPLPTL